MAVGLYTLRGVELAHEGTGPATRGWIVKSADKSWYQTINLHLYLYLYTICMWIRLEHVKLYIPDAYYADQKYM